jgi:tRNA A58 N-methylase Trm61
MGIITNWLGCAPEAAIIEFGTGDTYLLLRVLYYEIPWSLL